jgi:hypothetical protein
MQGTNVEVYRIWMRSRKTRKVFTVNYPPAVYTLAEAKATWKTRWSIPVSPEIVVRHNGKDYDLSSIKEIW